MTTIARDGVKLAYQDAGAGDPPMVFVHGWTSDRWFLHKQADHFAQNHRVVSVDLRGHGESDAPEQDYTIEGFADDLAWTIGELGLDHPVVVGWSMGGAVVTQLAATRGDLLGALVLIDPPPFNPSPELAAAFGGAMAAMGDDLNGARTALIDSFFLPRHDSAIREEVHRRTQLERDQVVVNEFGHLLQWDGQSAAKQVSVPTLHIAAEPGFNHISAVEELIPNSVNGKAVGFGHLLQLEAPTQVNSMIESFIREYL